MNNSWLEELARRHRDAGVLLDAGLLVLWIVGTIDEKLIARHRRLTAYHVEHFHALRWIVVRFSKIVTTPHVLTEASNLSRQTNQDASGQILGALAQVVQAELRENEVREEFVPARELSRRPQFTTLGLADSAIVNAARQGALVLTDDGELLAEIDAQGLSAVSIRRLQIQYDG